MQENSTDCIQSCDIRLKDQDFFSPDAAARGQTLEVARPVPLLDMPWDPHVVAWWTAIGGVVALFYAGSRWLVGLWLP